MDIEEKQYTTNDFKIINQGNQKLSKKMVAKGLSSIKLGQLNVIEEGVILRGDLGIINIKNYSIVDKFTVLRPSITNYKSPLKYSKLTIHDNTYVGKNCVINAETIGSCVFIGDNCVIVLG